MTALIYVGIIAVWAAVLVPMWLRLDDHRRARRRTAGPTGQVLERLASRRSVLGIPLPSRTARLASADPGSQPAEEAVQSSPGPGRRGEARDRRRRRGRLSSSAKRRIVLLLLLCGSIAVATLVGLGLLPWPVAVAPALVLICFVLIARRQVVIARRNRARARRRTASRDGGAVSPQAPPAPMPEAAPAPGTWMPRATPLPSYLRTPGESDQPIGASAWTAAAMLERAQRERMRAEGQGGRSRTGRDRIREEQQAAAVDDRDDEFLRAQSARWSRGSIEAPFRRASNQ